MFCLELDILRVTMMMTFSNFLIVNMAVVLSICLADFTGKFIKDKLFNRSFVDLNQN